MATWDNTFQISPADGDNPSQGASKIRETRSELALRLKKEMTWEGTSTVDGFMRVGSAKAYVQAAAPTLRPDGVTALTSTGDAGRLLLKTSTGSGLFVRKSNGVFVSTGVTLSTAQTIVGTKTFNSGGIINGSPFRRKNTAWYILTTTAPSHGGLATKLSALVPASSTFILVGGGWTSFQSSPTTLVTGRAVCVRAYRSTSGSLYLESSINSESTNKSTGNPAAPASGRNLIKISTGAVAVSSVMNGMFIAW